MQLETRNATLNDLTELLKEQHDLKYDVVVSPDRLSYSAGQLRIEDGATDITDWGVKLQPAYLRPTALFDEQIATKLKIPIRYLRRMRDEAVTLLDDNVNHWLSRHERNVFVRGFNGNGWGETGIARAFLSDQFSVIDHLDGLFASLDGIQAAGVPVDIGKCHLTERSMHVEVKSEAVAAHAPYLLGDYRSPFTGGRGVDADRIFAGFVIRNSETGGGAFSIVPRITIEVCTNGMTVKKDAMRKVHLGARMDEGEIRWSEETRRHYVELVKNQTADAVRTFLSQDYLDNTVSRLSQTGRNPIDNVTSTLQTVSKRLNYTEEEMNGIMNMFISGGQMRAFGVAQAVTAYAQVVDSPDRAAELEDSAWDAMLVAAR